jgi:hypothetical protein
MMKKTILLLLSIGLFSTLFAQQQQDLNVTVKVTDVQIQLTDKSVFRKLEADIKQFFSNVKWSNDKICTDFICYEKLPAYRDFTGVRIEDNVLVVPEGHKILGNPIPKSISEVEALRS